MVKQAAKNGAKVTEVKANEEENPENDDEKMDSEDNENKSDSSEDETFKPDTRLDPENDKDKIEAVNKLGKQINVERIITRDSFVALSDRAKRDKVSGGRSILEFFFGIMAPDAAKKFGAKVCAKFQAKEEPKNTAANNIIKAVGKQYKLATDKIMKQIILGPVAATCDYREVVLHIPGLSYFKYNKAKRCFNADEIPKDLPKVYHRYDENKITEFVEFITSPHCMILQPYGVNSVTLSNGQKLDVAANTRMLSSSQLIRMFRKKKEEAGFGPADVLPSSTMYSILELCHASKSKELTCVDYYLAAGLDGFEVLEETADHWLTTEDITVDESKMLVKELKMGQEYLQTDFPMHLEQHTEVISHCINYALGDPITSEFTNECEEHFTICPRCQSLLDTLESFKKRIISMVESCKKEETLCTELDDLETKQIQVEYAVFNIVELRSHIIRAKISEMERAQDLSELDETKAYITIDWAQKYLPTKYRETQKDYFGKDGMSYQIIHVQTVKDSLSVEYSYVHIIQQNKQDSTAVVAILVDVLKRLKSKGIISAILRSDNAGCYHSKEVILSLAEISKTSEVKITKYSFSEPQNGKGNCDRIAALVKNKVRRHIREGNNVNDEKDFFNAMVSLPGMSYVTVVLATVERVTQVIKPAALRGIASYYVFTPQDKGILVHRAANIGKGKLFKYSNTNLKLQKLPSLKIEKEQTFEKIDNEDFWKSSRTRNRKDGQEESCQTFDCPKAGCDFTTSSYGEFMTHVVFEDHAKTTMRDFAAIVYRQAVKQQKPTVNFISQALAAEMINENALTEANTPKLGYAHKQPKKLPKITDKAEKFVREKFNEGTVSKAKKWKPKQVVDAMMIAKNKDDDNRRFRPTEILFVEQVQQLFSKFAAEQKKAPKEPPNKKQKTTSEVEVTETESESEEEDLNAGTDTDEDTRQHRQNRHTYIVTRARRRQLEKQIEESFQAVAEAITED